MYSIWVVEYSVYSVECHGFESHPRLLIFSCGSDCLGCVVLVWFVVCMTLLASFFPLSASLNKHVHVQYMYSTCTVHVQYMYKKHVYTVCHNTCTCMC